LAGIENTKLRTRKETLLADLNTDRQITVTSWNHAYDKDWSGHHGTGYRNETRTLLAKI